ncbi:MAG: TonB-dependent receptor [Tannerella sp.]|jgi:TonB-linked SusC/RagA family outer membrane protein|nr:TonB-dependent receptor [Tannerella sp.]
MSNYKQIFLRAMLSSMFLIFSGYIAATAQITLSIKNKQVREVLKSIEKTSDYRFFYNDDLPGLEANVSIRIEKGTITAVMNQLSQQAGLAYSIRDNNQVILSAKEAVPQQPARLLIGMVTDESGEPVIGANIKEKGTTNGTVTDADGNFSLDVSENAVLQISYIGYIVQEISVLPSLAGGGRPLIIRLIEDMQALDEVVVIGYGSQSKMKLTGSSSFLKSDELGKVQGTNFVQQMIGKMSGIIINETSGLPNLSPQIIIRGIGTLTAGTAPLIVIDGFPLSEGTALNSINPNDIESVNVLKDAAAASIYGSRGANGVILVTTKKGQIGRYKVEFNYYTGFQQQSSRLELCDAAQTAQYLTEARDWGYVSRNPANRSENDDDATRISKGANTRQRRLYYLTDPGLSGLADTNWLNEVFRLAPVSNYSVSISGGNDRTSYLVSANYLDQQGTVIETDYKRYSSSFTLETKLSSKLKFDVSFNPSYSIYNTYNEDGGGNNENPLAIALIMYPFFAPYNDDGTLAIGTQLTANALQDGALAENPVAIMKTNVNKRKNFRIFGRGALTFDLTKNLQFKSLLGGDFRGESQTFYTPSYVGQYRTKAPKPARAIEYALLRNNFITENTLSFNNRFENHQIDLVAGYSFQKEEGTSVQVNGSSIPDDNIQDIAGASAFSASDTKYIWTQISGFARAQYFYKERYQFSTSVRRDGSSRFGANTKWGVFPSAAAGWIFSMEPFFPKNNIVSFAKLRASWGQTGNNQIGTYGAIATMNQTNYVYGTTLATGYATSTSPNPDLSWETRSSTNIGFDFSFINNLFSFSTNYYRVITKDMLLDVPVPQQSGYSSSTQNIGKMSNSGYEFEIGGNNIKIGNVSWNFGGNLSTNKNEILALAPDQTEIISGYQGSYRTKVGGPIGELYGYNILGVYKTQEEIDNTPHFTGTVTGDYIIEDLDKNGVVDTNDKKGFGSYEPKFVWGFNSTLRYRQFEFGFLLNAVGGRKKFDADLSTALEVGEGWSTPTTYYFENRYHPVNNPDGFLAQPNYGNFTTTRQQARGSSIMFKDADYIRLRQIQIAYNLPKVALDKLRMSGMRIYISGNNLLTFTDYLGFNPDSSSGSLLTLGYGANGTSPINKSVIFGFGASF